VHSHKTTSWWIRVLGHALEHRRLFPEAPEPHVRLGHATMALQCIRALGRGSAYLPQHMVSAELAEKALHLVADAPVIRKTAFATYPIRSNREALITSALAFIHPT
jgi:DNA-binding transcriptional LysR family regulator